MEGMINLAELRNMSSQDLIDKLAEHENVDDLIEAELQRRSLSKLNLMTWSSLAVMGMAIIGLTLSGLLLTGVFSRPGSKMSQSPEAACEPPEALYAR